MRTGPAPLERPHRHGPGTESARLAPKCIASRPASTDMQDSGVDGPHTTGMRRTSYRPHTPSPGPPGSGSGTRLFFFHLSPSVKPCRSLSFSLVSPFHPSFLFAAFFLPLTSYHSGRVNGFGRPLGLPSANLSLVSLGWEPGFLTGFARATIDRRSRSAKGNAHDAKVFKRAIIP